MTLLLATLAIIATAFIAPAVCVVVLIFCALMIGSIIAIAGDIVRLVFGWFRA